MIKPAPHFLAVICVGWLLSLTAPARAQDKPAEKPAATKTPATDKKEVGDKTGGEWKPLFDGKTLTGWKKTDFGGGSSPEVQDGKIVMPIGESLSGITYTNEPPNMNYEVSFDAMKTDGNDFFAALTFLVEKTKCTLVVGGWGGGVVGLSSIDGQDASENETTKYMRFDKNKWYNIRLRVTPKRIQAWIDNDSFIDFDTTDRKIALRYGEIDLSAPLGIATWQTSAAWKNIKIKTVK
jgi:hypothetical protein